MQMSKLSSESSAMIFVTISGVQDTHMEQNFGLLMRKLMKIQNTAVNSNSTSVTGWEMLYVCPLIEEHKCP